MSWEVKIDFRAEELKDDIRSIERELDTYKGFVGYPILWLMAKWEIRKLKHQLKNHEPDMGVVRIPKC